MAHGSGASAAATIADDLRMRLLSLELFPGVQLREADLAGQYGAGRHTVRAALAMLEADGLVEHDRHRGTRVRRFTSTDLTDTFDLREALEVASARIICERGADLSALDTAVQRLEECEHREESRPGLPTEWETLHADREVHRALVEASGSRRLVQAYRAIATELEYCYSLYRVAAIPADDHEHAAIAVALRQRDEAEAVRLISTHIRDARRDLSAAMEHGPRAAGPLAVRV